MAPLCQCGVSKQGIARLMEHGTASTDSKLLIFSLSLLGRRPSQAPSPHPHLRHQFAFIYWANDARILSSILSWKLYFMQNMIRQITNWKIVWHSLS